MLRDVKFDDTGYVAGIVDHALSEERRQAGELGYTMDEWKALDAARYPLRLDHKQNVGRLLQTSVDNEGQLWVHALFDRTTQEGDQLWQRVKSGDLHSLSIGFNALEPAPNSESRRNMNIFKEVSVTSNPKKPHAKIKVRCSNTAAAAADGEPSTPAEEEPLAASSEPKADPEPPSPAVVVVEEVVVATIPEPAQPTPMETDLLPAVTTTTTTTAPVEVPKTINLELPVVAVTTPSIPVQPEPPQMSAAAAAPMSVDAPAPTTTTTTTTLDPVAAATQTQLQTPAPSQVQTPVSDSTAAHIARLLAAEKENEQLKAERAEAEAAKLELKRRDEKRAKKAADRKRAAQEKNLAELDDVKDVLGAYDFLPRDDPVLKTITEELASNEHTARMNSLVAKLARELREAKAENKVYNDLIGTSKKPATESSTPQSSSNNAASVPQQQKNEAKEFFNWQKIEADVKQLREQQSKLVAPNSTVPTTGLAALEAQLAASGKSQASSLGITPQQLADATSSAMMAVDPQIPESVIKYERETNPINGFMLLHDMIQNGLNPGMEIRCSNGSGPSVEEAMSKLWPRAVGRPEPSRPFLEMMHGKHSQYLEKIAADKPRMQDGRLAFDIRVQSTPFRLNDEAILAEWKADQDRKERQQRIRF